MANRPFGKRDSRCILGLDDPSAEADLRGNWFTVEGSYADASGNGYDGTSNITFFVDECPQEDLDGDGVATWEDCDDGDANLPNSDDQDCDGILASAGDCDDLNALVGMNITGVSTDCAALSCDEVSTMGYSTGDGVYWLNPDGNGAFEAYCDMTTDGGGWTLAAKIESGSGSQWLYDSTAWTTNQNAFNETDFNLTSGEAKYTVFDTVALEEIRLEDPVNVNATQLEAVGTSLLDFLNTQAANTSANVLSTDYTDDSPSPTSDTTHWVSVMAIAVPSSATALTVTMLTEPMSVALLDWSASAFGALDRMPIAGTKPPPVALPRCKSVRIHRNNPKWNHVWELYAALGSMKPNRERDWAPILPCNSSSSPHSKCPIHIEWLIILAQAVHRFVLATRRYVLRCYTGESASNSGIISVSSSSSCFMIWKNSTIPVGSIPASTIWSIPLHRRQPRSP